MSIELHARNMTVLVVHNGEQMGVPHAQWDMRRFIERRRLTQSQRS